MINDSNLDLNDIGTVTIHHNNPENYEFNLILVISYNFYILFSFLIIPAVVRVALLSQHYFPDTKFGRNYSRRSRLMLDPTRIH